MKKALLAMVFMCLAASVASATSACTGESTVAGGGATLQASLVGAGIVSLGSPAYSGSLDSCAYTGASGSPFLASDVTFIYQAFAGPTPSTDISGITFGNFGSSLLTFSDSSVGCGSCTAPFFAFSNGSGGAVFDFAPVIPVGGQSDYLIVYTNQTTINAGVASLHDNTTSGLAADLATTAVPEPASMTLLGTGLIGLAGLLRRKFQGIVA